MCSNHDFSLAAEGGQKIWGYLGVDLLSRALETEGGQMRSASKGGPGGHLLSILLMGSLLPRVVLKLSLDLLLPATVLGAKSLLRIPNL